MAKKKPLKDKVSSQAQADASLKYAPQKRALTAQQQAVADQFQKSAAAETASSRGIAAQIDTVKPKVAGYVGEAQGVSDRASQDLGAYLNGSVLQGAAARDSAGTKRRLSEMLASSNTELDQRKVDAAAGAKYTIGSLRASAGKQLESIGGKLTDLASDEGTYASTQADKIRNAAAGRAVTKRGQDLSHQDRVDSLEQRKQVAADKKTKDKGFKPATPIQQQDVQSKIDAAKSIAADQKAKGNDRGQVEKWLIDGRESQSVTASNGTKVKVPGINKTDSLYASIATDLAWDGHVSDRNRKLLNKLGISVKQLGLPTRGTTKQGLTSAISGLKIPQLKKP